jgi:hypothetical protein
LSPNIEHSEISDRKMSVIACRHCRKILQYRKPSDLPYFPFCSERCKLLDLGGWLDEKHRIPGNPISDKKKDD